MRSKNAALVFSLRRVSPLRKSTPPAAGNRPSPYPRETRLCLGDRDPPNQPPHEPSRCHVRPSHRAAFTSRPTRLAASRTETAPAPHNACRSSQRLAVRTRHSSSGLAKPIWASCAARPVLIARAKARLPEAEVHHRPRRSRRLSCPGIRRLSCRSRAARLPSDRWQEMGRQSAGTDPHRPVLPSSAGKPPLTAIPRRDLIE